MPPTTHASVSRYSTKVRETFWPAIVSGKEIFYRTGVIRSKVLRMRALRSAGDRFAAGSLGKFSAQRNKNGKSAGALFPFKCK